MKQMIKAVTAKLLLNLAVWAFDKFYNFIDKDKDGKISKKELLETAQIIDKQSRTIVRRLKQ